MNIWLILSQPLAFCHKIQYTNKKIYNLKGRGFMNLSNLVSKVSEQLDSDQPNNIQEKVASKIEKASGVIDAAKKVEEVVSSAKSSGIADTLGSLTNSKK